MTARRRLTAGQARRVVLAGLGMQRRRPVGRIDARHFRRVYDHIRVLQIDPINVLARAHHQVVMSRLGPYDTDALDRFVWRSGEVYEGWIHVDATAQVDTWPLFAHRRASTLPWRAVRHVMDERPEYMQSVMDDVAERGPLSAAQLDDPGGRITTWGSRSMGRAALDYHHLRGDLAIAWRDDRMTAYFDLPERVIPAVWLDAPVPSPDDAERALLLRALHAVGVGTAADLADHHRQHVPTARRHLAEMAADGVVDRVDVEGWRGPVYAVPDLVVPRGIGAATLLNPFDPVMWNRPRVARMFDLDYTVEIYVPAEKRRWGYYVLPFLLGDRLVALVDLKHDRKAGVLRVAAAHLLPEADAATVVTPLVEELHTWARWVGAGEVEVVDRGDLAGPLSSRV